MEVPISLDINDKATEKGINSYRAILKQTKDALDILKENNPERIVILGGYCVDRCTSRYSYEGYHAIALTACLGMGDKEIINTLPTKVDASKALLVGLREWDTGMQER